MPVGAGAHVELPKRQHLHEMSGESPTTPRLQTTFLARATESERTPPKTTSGLERSAVRSDPMPACELIPRMTTQPANRPPGSLRARRPALGESVCSNEPTPLRRASTPTTPCRCAHEPSPSSAHAFLVARAAEISPASHGIEVSLLVATHTWPVHRGESLCPAVVVSARCSSAGGVGRARGGPGARLC